MPKQSKVNIYDGSNLLHVYFHALPITYMDRKVGGIYGLVHTLLFSHKPHIHTNAVVFDYDRKSTFRTKLYPPYKAHRSPPDPDIPYNYDKVIELLKTLGVKVYIQKGWEADDIIGTLATSWAAQGYKVTIFSQDKDFFQLIDKNISISRKPYKKNKQYIIDSKNWQKYMDVSPSQFRDFLAICGDPVDNIQGVRGIGKVRAKNLLEEYGDIKTMYHMLESGKGKFTASIRKKLLAGKPSLDLSLKLVTILCSLDNINTEKVRDHPIDFPAAIEKLTDLGMLALVRKLRAIQQETNLCMDLAERSNRQADQRYSDLTEENIEECRGRVVVYTKIDSLFYITIEGGHSYCTEDPSKVKRGLACAKRIISYRVKEEVSFLETQGVLSHDFPWEDLHLMQYILQGKTDHQSLKELMIEYAFSRGLPTENIMPHAFTLYDEYHNQLRTQNTLTLYLLEKQVSRILMDMEARGIKLNREALVSIEQTLKEKLVSIEKQCYALAGMQFNILSVRESKHILTGIFGLPLKKSLDAAALRSCQHPMADLILLYREYAKILTTYTYSLLQQADQADRIHTHYSQTSVYTGRLSSFSPNLQNLPDKMGIRKCFIPAEGYSLVSLDFSQIELRLAAHLSGDPNLIQAFEKDLDIHTQNAITIFGKDTHEYRSMAKRLNFGILYGIGAGGLSKAIDKSIPECQEIIKQFFLAYPQLKQYLDNLKTLCRERGYVTSMCNRRIYLPDIRSSDEKLRTAAERQSINAPIQGSAAEVMKFAMVAAAEYIKTHKLGSRILLQIHDELVLEIKQDEIEHITALSLAMCNAYPLKVPLKCGIDLRKWG